MSLEEERKLIERAKIDPLAFGKIYDIYYPKISNYLLHRIPDVSAAQDITSEVFFKAMTKLHTFSWRNISFSSWLYKIANNEINMHFRKKKRKFFSIEFLFETHHIEFPSVTDIEQEYITVEEELAKNKEFKEIQSHLLLLPQIYQEVLTLRFLEEKSLAEISEITGKNINTIKSLVLRGKEKLRNRVQRKQV